MTHRFMLSFSPIIYFFSLRRDLYVPAGSVRLFAVAESGDGFRNGGNADTGEDGSGFAWLYRICDAETA